MAVSDVRVGFEAVINYKVGGQDGVGEWLELANVKDNTLSLEATEIEATTRSSGGWRQLIPGIKEAGVEFEILWVPTDPGCQALREAFWNREMIGLQILDETDGHGLQGDFAVFKFPRNEQLEEGLTISVGVKPTVSATPPSWIEPV